jgi:stage III sporulation protein AB
MLRQMMLLLRGEIRYAKTELPEAFYHVSMRLPQPFSDFLTELSEAMKAMDGQPMYVLWGEYIDRKLSGSCLSADDLEAFKMLGRHLGFLDQDMQLAAIDMYTESLDTTMAALRQSLGQKQKTSLCLGILSGFFLSVLLL